MAGESRWKITHHAPRRRTAAHHGPLIRNPRRGRATSGGNTTCHRRRPAAHGTEQGIPNFRSANSGKNTPTGRLLSIPETPRRHSSPMTLCGIRVFTHAECPFLPDRTTFRGAAARSACAHPVPDGPGTPAPCRPRRRGCLISLSSMASTALLVAFDGAREPLAVRSRHLGISCFRNSIGVKDRGMERRFDHSCE